jgi:hypothetical protein
MRISKNGGSLKRKMPPLLVLLTTALLTFTGITAARYVMQSRQSGIVEAEKFYFTSDLLKEQAEEAIYYIDPKTIEFTVKLFNFEDSKRITAEEIQFSAVVEGGGGGVSSSLSGGTKTEQSITAIPEAGKSEIKVTVTSSSPFEKILTAKFLLARGNRYIVEDAAGYTAAALTITCTDSGKTISLTLPAGVIPDATDGRVKASGGGYTYTVPGPGVYSLVLLKSDPQKDISKGDTDFADAIQFTD